MTPDEIEQGRQQLADARQVWVQMGSGHPFYVPPAVADLVREINGGVLPDFVAVRKEIPLRTLTINANDYPPGPWGPREPKRKAQWKRERAGRR